MSGLDRGFAPLGCAPDAPPIALGLGLRGRAAVNGRAARGGGRACRPPRLRLAGARAADAARGRRPAGAARRARARAAAEPGPARAGAARARALVPRRRARLPRPLPAPAGRGRDPARRRRAARRARVGGGRGPRRDPGRRRHERRRRRRRPARRARRRDRPGARAPARRARADAALLPAVVRARDARRLARDARRRPLRHRPDARRRPRRVDPRDHRGGGGVGVAPASGAGPSPDRLLLGSEGTLAIVTEAWMRVQPRPAERRGASVAFADFTAGAAAVRAIVQDGLRPANCRLIDAREAALTLAGDGSAALLVLGFESTGAPLGEQFERAAELCREHGGDVTPSPPSRRGAGASWREAFLRAPYVRDTLVAIGVLSETFESAITWDRLGAFVEQVTGATRAALGADGLVTVRLTHAYPDGAAPYFTVIAPARRGDEEQQWHADGDEA